MSEGEADILARVGSLNLWKRHGERAPHKPLLLLLALGRLQRGEPRLAPFIGIEPRLNELLPGDPPDRRQHVLPRTRFHLPPPSTTPLHAVRSQSLLQAQNGSSLEDVVG
jgi:hypothetical protein